MSETTDARKRRLERENAATDPQKDRRAGKGVRVCADESRPAAGADMTSSLTIRHTEGKAAGPVAHAGTGGTPADETRHQSHWDPAVRLRVAQAYEQGRVDGRAETLAEVERHSAEWFMDQWWRTTGDDWPVPEHLPKAFVQRVLLRGMAEAGDDQ